MAIKRKPNPEFKWYSEDFPEASTYGLFSYERWGETIDWDALSDQAKKIDSIVLLIDKYAFGTKLFAAYIDILEANMHVFDDLFYYLVGSRIGGEPDVEKFIWHGPLGEISSRLFFWILDYRDSVVQIHKQLLSVQNHIVRVLNLRVLEPISKIIAEEWSHGFYIKSHKDDPPDIIFTRDQAYSYATGAYAEKHQTKPLAHQILNVLNMLRNAIMVFGLDYDLPPECFPHLLKQYRESENGQNLIKAWERDFDCSRDRLLEKMEKLPDLKPWVHRYLHLQGDEEVAQKLFHDEDGCWLVDDKEYYSTKNWISILKVATILQVYDERQASGPSPRPEDGKARGERHSHFPFYIDKERGMRLLRALIEHFFIDATTDEASFLYLMGCVSEQPTGLKPIKWVKNKQLLREMLELTFQPLLDNKNLRKADLERLAPLCFVGKDDTPMRLAKRKDTPSTDSDELKKIFATILRPS